MMYTDYIDIAGRSPAGGLQSEDSGWNWSHQRASKFFCDAVRYRQANWNSVCHAI